MEKQCLTCGIIKDISAFPKNGKTKYGTLVHKSKCKKCYNTNQRIKRVKTPKKLKYKNDEERRAAARYRSKIWYKNNKDKARRRISEWQHSEQGKIKREQWFEEWKLKNPLKWRLKKKRDKSIRRSREVGIPSLDLSSIVFLESYNLLNFKSNQFLCEYCLCEVGCDYHIDHIVPISKGGTNELVNLAISCPKCNLSKGSNLVTDTDQLSYFRNRKFK